MEGTIDFDPTTAEGREDINEDIENEGENLLPQENESDDLWVSRIKSRFGDGYRYAINRIRDLFISKHPNRPIPEYMELKNLGEGSSSVERMKEYIIDSTKNDLKERYPNIDLNLIDIDFKDGYEYISYWSHRYRRMTTPQKIYKTEYIRNSTQKREILKKVDNILRSRKSSEGIIDLNNSENRVLRERLRNTDGESQRYEIISRIEENEEEIEQIEERLPLRDRVKQIIKRHGLTVTGIALAVGTIIGVIVSNLKAGLINVAKGVGNGLKILGKKLGEILPGMVGAIASFIFRTAGQVVGFLAKNTWLLIVAVVMYVVERYKK